jgi:hypothetical protein
MRYGISPRKAHMAASTGVAARLGQSAYEREQAIHLRHPVFAGIRQGMT